LKSVIQVRNLSKKYRIGKAEQKADTFFGAVFKGLKQPLQNLRQIQSLSRFDKDLGSISWALRDISFDVKQGEVLGIIGRNGAGKSTLLKVLSRITEPSSGEIILQERVAALLEVGTGFHPELSGRENIYMNGTILGMRRREIDKKIDEIIDFSGVEKYLDTPVKFYSSGMRVRLGFSVAAHLEPEILIIDEVLAVGDVEFQKKCIGKMENVARSEGRTVLFVSHNMHAVNELCPRTLVIDKGQIAYDGNTDGAVNYYLRGNELLTNAWKATEAIDSQSKVKNFVSIDCEVSGTQPISILVITFEVDHGQTAHDCFVAFDIINSRGEAIMQALPTLEKNITQSNGLFYRSEITLIGLIPGTYYVTCWMGQHNTMTDCFVEQVVSFTVTSSPTKGRTFPHTWDHGYLVPSSTLLPVSK
jgi:lipopolysaccharide transport system ATP-binding protein